MVPRIIAASILVITFFVRDFFDSLFLAFHHVAFQVASIITTTASPPWILTSGQRSRKRSWCS